MNRLMMKLMGFVVMNEAPADGGASGAAPAAAPAAQGAAPAADPAAAPAAAPAATTLTPPATPAATDPKPEGEPPAKPREEAKPKAGDQPEGAPEAYADFKVPEGISMDADVLGEFKGLAKELNIPQAAAQKLIDLQARVANKQAEEQQAAVIKQGQEWAAEVKNDPELGGANYDKSVASAIKVIQSFGDESLTNLLNESGLGNHPALFKFCHRISQAISEDKFVLPGSQASAPKEMSIIDAFK